jgi:hypothetical protein
MSNLYFEDVWEDTCPADKYPVKAVPVKRFTKEEVDAFVLNKPTIGGHPAAKHTTVVADRIVLGCDTCAHRVESQELWEKALKSAYRIAGTVLDDKGAEALPRCGRMLSPRYALEEQDVTAFLNTSTILCWTPAADIEGTERDALARLIKTREVVAGVQATWEIAYYNQDIGKVTRFVGDPR